VGNSETEMKLKLQKAFFYDTEIRFKIDIRPQDELEEVLRNNKGETSNEIMSTDYFSDSDDEGKVVRMGTKDIMDSQFDVIESPTKLGRNQ